MKSTVLTALMVTFALSTVACEKKEDCLKDAGCLAQARAMAGPQLFPLTAAIGPEGQVPPNQQPLQPFRVSTVANAAIKAKSLKVQAALKADDENPNSTYYKSPTPEIPQGERVPSRTTASAMPAVAADPGTTGEAAR